MNNYSIDASVYAYPFQTTTPSLEEIIEYAKAIGNLYKLVIQKKPHYIRYYFFLRDIKLLRNLNLDLTKINIDVLPKGLSLDKLKNQLRAVFNEIIGTNSSKYTIFENWFKIEDVSLRTEPQLPDDISKNIINEALRNNLKKNISIIAALNKNVYKNNEIHKIILSNNVTSKNMQITGRYNIVMKWGLDRDEDMNEYPYDYKIKNFPYDNEIKINAQNVMISTLDTIINENFNIPLWQEVINKPFRHITFGPEVEDSIKQYVALLVVNQKEGKEKLIEKWMYEFPNILYSNLKALDNFLCVMDGTSITKIYSDHRYNDCKQDCELFSECGSHIRLFGVNCINETKNQKNNPNNPFVEKDRTRKNNQGSDNPFWIHLRPKNRYCDDPLWFLTLRIHFRWIRSDKKIEIGWIGRHLYLPCHKKNKQTQIIEGCERSNECPLNPNCPSPLRDPNLNEYENYLKQWPKNP
jgi:hypothetical protein